MYGTTPSLAPKRRASTASADDVADAITREVSGEGSMIGRRQLISLIGVSCIFSFAFVFASAGARLLRPDPSQDSSFGEHKTRAAPSATTAGQKQHHETVQSYSYASDDNVALSYSYSELDDAPSRGDDGGDDAHSRGGDDGGDDAHSRSGDDGDDARSQGDDDGDDSQVRGDDAGPAQSDDAAVGPAQSDDAAVGPAMDDHAMVPAMDDHGMVPAMDDMMFVLPDNGTMPNMTLPSLANLTLNESTVSDVWDTDDDAASSSGFFEFTMFKLAVGGAVVLVVLAACCVWGPASPGAVAAKKATPAEVRHQYARAANRVVGGAAVLLFGLAALFIWASLSVTESRVTLGSDFHDAFDAVDGSRWLSPSESASGDCQWTNGDEFCEDSSMNAYGVRFENATAATLDDDLLENATSHVMLGAEVGLEMTLVGDGDCSCKNSDCVAGHLTTNDYFLHGTLSFRTRFFHRTNAYDLADKVLSCIALYSDIDDDHNEMDLCYSTSGDEQSASLRLIWYGDRLGPVFTACLPSANAASPIGQPVSNPLVLFCFTA